MSDEHTSPETGSADKKEIEEILHQLPEEMLVEELADRIQRNPESRVQQVIAAAQHSFSGPLPPPAMLGQYDQVKEGLADRIVCMAERQQAHRQEMESKALNASIRTERVGQNYALLLSLVIVTGSIFLIATGKEISGSLLAGGTLCGLAYIFITGRKEERDNSEQKTRNSV